jgi:hypothetical protein
MQRNSQRFSLNLKIVFLQSSANISTCHPGDLIKQNFDVALNTEQQLKLRIQRNNRLETNKGRSTLTNKLHHNAEQQEKWTGENVASGFYGWGANRHGSSHKTKRARVRNHCVPICERDLF